VLQEVAAARHVVIICGSAEIDGYTFCLGLDSLPVTGDYMEIHNRIRSASYLIKGAIFRPKSTIRSLDRFSLEIRSLGELVDMYHARDATNPLDKVYALLGMSSDNYIPDGLLPDYSISWRELFYRLVKFLLGEQVLVEIVEEKIEDTRMELGNKIAAIKGKGCILGEVSSVRSDGTWSDRQQVDIDSKNTEQYLGESRESSAYWTLNISAKTIQKGDLICFLQGSLVPTIIRPCEDCFAIIVVAAMPIESTQTAGKYVRWPEALRSITTFPRDLLLIWSWENKEFNSLMNYQVVNQSNKELKGSLDKASRLWNAAMVLEDGERYDEAGMRLQKVLEDYRRGTGQEYPNKLTILDNLAMIYKKSQRWDKAEELCLDTIQTRKQVQGMDHPDTLNSMVNLSSVYRENKNLKEADKWKVMADILGRTGDFAQITEEGISKVARSSDLEVMMLLLEQIAYRVSITEQVVKGAVRNEDQGRELMQFFLERWGEDIPITEEIIAEAMENQHGEQVMKLMIDHLKQRGYEVPITERVVTAARRNDKQGARMMELLLGEKSAKIRTTEEAIIWIIKTEYLQEGAVISRRFFDIEIMKLLLEHRREEVPITEEVVIAAVGDEEQGGGMIKLLFERRGDDMLITERVMIAAAGNRNEGERVMDTLFEKRAAALPITEDVVVAAAGNTWYGQKMMTHFFEFRGQSVPITERVMINAVKDERHGEEIVRLIFEKMGKAVPITERVIISAAGNSGNVAEIMEIIFEHKMEAVIITEEVVVAAARNEFRGPEVMQLLFKELGDTVPVTNEVLISAARNRWTGEQVIKLLFELLGDGVPITEAVVEAAAGNNGQAEEILELLFRRRGDAVPITEKAVEMAYQNINGFGARGLFNKHRIRRNLSRLGT
jgi:hypothetical protein